MQLPLLLLGWGQRRGGARRSSRGGVDEVDGVVEAGVAAGEEAEVTKHGNRGGGLEAAHLDELAELEAVGEDEVVEVGREGDVDGVGGVGDLDVEAFVGAEVWAGDGGDDAGDLEDGRGGVERAAWGVGG